MGGVKRSLGDLTRVMLGYILSFCLALILIAVSMLSIQLAVLAWVRVFRTAPKVPMAQLSDADLPHVLVQLPACNEGYLALRVAAAACALDWPRDRLTIQLLDDGTEENHTALAAGVIHRRVTLLKHRRCFQRDIIRRRGDYFKANLASRHNVLTANSNANAQARLMSRPEAALTMAGRR